MSFPQLGAIVGGKYRLLRQLGEGGMATVFEVENTLTLKRAAIKWVHPQFADPAGGLSRLVHEARASSRINHENVVNVYDVLEEGSSVFLVMELLEGEPLTSLLERAELPIHALIGLLLSAMRGVAAAHAAGVVHRDIKPDNIFLAQTPGYDVSVPKVIDFGISKMFDPEAAHVTRSGITMGTPRYVSYEQLLGARDVDARTDVYAFGVILYEALTGRPPYAGARSFGEQAIHFVTQVPVAPRLLRPDIPRQLEAIVVHAIERDRDQRHASLDALIEELEPFSEPARYPVELKSLSADHASAVAGTLDVLGTTVGPNGEGLVSGALSARLRTGSARPAPQRSSLPARAQRSRVAIVLGACAALAVPLVLWRDAAAPERAPGAQASLPLARDAGHTLPAASAPTAVTDTRAQVADGGAESATLSAPARTPSPRRTLRSRAVALQQAPLLGPPPRSAQSEPPSADAGAAPAEGDPRHRAGPVRRTEF